MTSDNNRSASEPHAIDWVWYLSALVIVLALGALNLQFPFVSDQVVALTGAKTIAAGGTLYVDFWDNKMPGLFWFYFVGGKLFGFTELGIHTLDLIWMTIFSVVLMVTLRKYVFYPWLSALLPLAVVGTYYVSVEPFLLTQLEAVVWLPIFLAAWFASRLPSSPKATRLTFLASGLCAGITVTFKLIFAPLFVVFWLIVSWHLYRVRRTSLGELVVNVWLPASAGVVGILTVVVLKFWSDGALDVLLWTAFDYPPQALAEAMRAPYYRLAESIRFFVTFYFAWSGFIGWALVSWWQRGSDLLTGLLVAWLALGLVLILVQRFSWWPYHFLILFPPAGILGVRGFAEFLRYLFGDNSVQRIRTVPLVLTLVIPLISVIFVTGGQKLTPYVTILIKKNGNIVDVREALSADYALVRGSTRFLADKTAIPGKIYVFGDPLYYHLSGRGSALPIIGWPWEYFLQSQWELLPAQLAAAGPPYIYVDKSNRIMMERRGGGVQEFVAERYVHLLDDRKGSWFILKPKFRIKVEPQ